MRFRDVSISWKLTLLAMVTTLFSLVAVISTVTLIDRHLSQGEMVASYMTLADIVGQTCQKKLETDDNSTFQGLLALREDSQVVAAGLFDRDGSVRASIPSRTGEMPSLERAQQLSGTFNSGYLHLVRPIRRPGGTIGHLYLQVSADQLTSRWRNQFLLICSLFCLSVLMAIAMAARLQRFISGPVLHLVDTAHHITQSGDYSIRAEKETGDELGELVDSFNEMLTTIEARNEQLDHHQQNLEELVRERTIELEQKSKEATAASVAKSAFLANMSHEIRTPMNAILGFADMLRRGVYDDENERVEFLDTICTSGKHLLGLINDILDLSKIEAGCMTTEHIPVSPHQLISDVVSITRVNAITKGLGIDYTWVGPVPKRIMTDPAKLRQLLINLVGNAIKFTERGGVHILAKLGLDQRHIQIQVIDSGIGIAADKLDTIFKPFSQADASMTRRFGGTGLGLSISRKISEALGGTLIVESEPGVGSTFTVTISTGGASDLELRAAPPVSDLIPASESEVGESSLTIPEGCRVLLVEDGDTNRRLIRKMLERNKFEVVEAINGKIGVELATASEFDVILMDMQMPVMDGYTASTELRNKGLTIPIVALTAHAMSGDAEKCRQAGCSEYLTKPIQEDRLLAKIGEILHRSAAGKDATDNHNVDELMATIGAAQVTADAKTTDTVDWTADAEQRLQISCALPLDDEVFREIVQEFSVKLNDQVERMKIAFAEEDWDELVQLGHWLKGSGGTAGYEQFTIPSGRLERMACERNLEKIESTLCEIEKLAKAVAREMELLPVMA